MKIEMTGYNDGKAIAIYSNIKIFPYFAVTLILSLVSMILALVFKPLRIDVGIYIADIAFVRHAVKHGRKFSRKRIFEGT